MEYPVAIDLIISWISKGSVSSSDVGIGARHLRMRARKARESQTEMDDEKWFTGMDEDGLRLALDPTVEAINGR